MDRATPDTVTEAMALLRAEGFTEDLDLASGDLVCAQCAHVHGPTELEVARVFRFEGVSDPGDAAIVIGVECEDCGTRGIVVSAYGVDADPELIALLDHLPS